MAKKIPTDAKRVFEWVLFDIYQKDQVQFDGSIKKFEWARTYDIAKWICIVDDRILILREQQPWYDVVREWLPGWMLERWEDIYDAIEREVREETWITFSDISLLVTLRSNVTLAEGYRHYFICRWVSDRWEQILDAGWEKIEITHLSFEEFITKIVDDSEFAHDIWDWILRNYVVKNRTEDLRRILFADK